MGKTCITNPVQDNLHFNQEIKCRKRSSHFLYLCIFDFVNWYRNFTRMVEMAFRNWSNSSYNLFSNKELDRKVITECLTERNQF